MRIATRRDIARAPGSGSAAPALSRRVALLVSGLALAGCGTQGSPPTGTSTTSATSTTPLSGATVLKENLPTEVDGVRLIAYNVEADTAGLQIGPDRRTVALDDTVTIARTRYSVAELVPSDSNRGDLPNGWVSLTSP